MDNPVRRRAYDKLKASGNLPKVGSGGRFKALSKQVGSPALAAYIGRKKYGRAGFQRLSNKGH